MKRTITLALAGFALLIAGMASGLALAVLEWPDQPEVRLETIRTIAVSSAGLDRVAGAWQGGSL